MSRLGRLQRHLVLPFYRKMAGFSATLYAGSLKRPLLKRSRTVTADDIAILMDEGWREAVMGAWFALALPDDDVSEIVVRGMASSQSELQALPLSAVSSLVAGSASIEAMEEYLDRVRELRHRDDSYEVVCAAIKHVGGAPPEVPPPGAREAFEEIYRVAVDLRRLFRPPLRLICDEPLQSFIRLVRAGVGPG